MGVIPGDKVQAEIGYDTLFPTSNPVGFFLNGKLCLPENSLGKGAPAISFGVYNLGFQGINKLQTFYAMVQKSLPVGGYIAGGLYHGLGDDALYTNETGKVVKTGAIVGWSSPDIKIGMTGLSKVDIIADVQTGKNALGAGAGGLDIYFNDYIGLIIGPVFYFDRAVQPGQSKMFWTTQLDVDIPLGKKKP
jgi:hypothetical protein